MEYIRRRGTYFMTETGAAWTPIGYNESFTWDAMKNDPGLHLSSLAAKGVNCIRLMFEYAETPDGLLEYKIGEWNPHVLDSLNKCFKAAQSLGIRFIVSPYDTYWQWKNWKHHPYNKANGGYLEDPKVMLLDPKTLEIHKQRFQFLIENFSSDGTIFAWDLWNEIHPAYANETDEGIKDYITEMSKFVRDTETKLFGKAHLQTVSIFGPAFRQYKHLNLRDPIFKHPSLDFCSVHLYDDATISKPKNTVESALTVGTYVRDILAQIPDARPFMDTESGPIGTFIDEGKTLSEEFDNEYFSNMSWAHLASGGAGPGMRWPYRNPHQLTPGMLDTLSSVSEFCKLVNWNRFSRENISSSILYNNQTSCKIMACGSASKFLINILRTNAFTPEGVYKEDKRGFFIQTKVSIPNVLPGAYKIVSWKEKTKESSMVIQETEKQRDTSNLTFLIGLRRSLMLYIEKI